MPTKEAAPETFGVWLPQRSRWSKGWMQTWLVHMRQPVRLFRDLGPASFVISQVLLFGIVFSTLAHPFIVYAVAEMMVALFTGYQLSPWKVALFCVDLINIVCAYGAYIAITIVALKQRGVRVGWTRYVAMTPIYWFMMSAAAWLGLFELWWRPFHWNKTPHKPIRRLKVGPRSVVL